MLKVVRNADKVLRHWENVGYVILMPHGNGSYAHFNLHNINAYMYMRDMYCDHPYRFEGKDFAFLRRLSLQKTPLTTFEYTNGFLHNATNMIPCEQLRTTLVPKNITEGIPYRHLGTWYNHYHYRVYQPFVGDGKYSYVYFKKRSVIMGSRTFFMRYDDNGLDEDAATTEGQLAIHKDMLLFLPQDSYDIYVYKRRYYIINPSGTVYFTVTPTRNEPYNLDLPPLEKYSYLELSKEFRDVKKKISRRFNMYLDVYFTSKALVFKRRAGDKYFVPISQSRGDFPKHLKVLAPMLGFFSPGYFYITRDRDPNILVKYDPWHKIWYGTILKEVDDEDL